MVSLARSLVELEGLIRGSTSQIIIVILNFTYMAWATLYDYSRTAGTGFSDHQRVNTYIPVVTSATLRGGNQRGNQSGLHYGGVVHTPSRGVEPRHFPGMKRMTWRGAWTVLETVVRSSQEREMRGRRQRFAARPSPHCVQRHESDETRSRAAVCGRMALWRRRVAESMWSVVGGAKK
ncbi:hypothetical protein DFH06DRAFT_1139398 [Mycena polygramma]|nr:hypothetical protein DFH06DRAFT_1139398 [Mycena polygramma]